MKNRVLSIVPNTCEAKKMNHFEENQSKTRSEDSLFYTNILYLCKPQMTCTCLKQTSHLREKEYSPSAIINT